MKDIQNLVYKFMEKEQVTLKQALLQSSLGMCSKTGDIAEIVRGVVYNDYPYTEERKKRNVEHLGELLFHWIMLASTTGVGPDEIMNQYISSYVKRNKIIKESEADAARVAHASIVEMFKYVKDKEHVK